MATARHNHITKIEHTLHPDTFLYIGGTTSLHYTQKCNIDAIICLDDMQIRNIASMTDPLIISLSVPDNVALDINTTRQHFFEAAVLVHELLTSGLNTLICCYTSVHESPIAAGYYLKLFEKMDPDRIIKTLKAEHPQFEPTIIGLQLICEN